VQVLAPRPNALIRSRNAAAAARKRIRAVLRVGGGRVTRLKVQLNGHPVRRVTRRAGVHRMLLHKANGLRVGQNLLWVSANFRGSKHPLQKARRFVVGYRVHKLLTSSGVRLGARGAPAARVSVRAPLRGVNRITAALNGKRLPLPDARNGKRGRRVLHLNLAHLGKLLRFDRNRCGCGS
jgi:hypothetical protein